MKMHSVYLNTCHGLQIALIDCNQKLLKYHQVETNRSSNIIHSEIFHLLNEFELKARNIEEWIWCCGPGSYTGMRLAKGIIDTLELANVKNINFYNFEIPRFCNVSQGIWIENAFKGEFFIYEWNVENTKQYFIKEKDFDSSIFAQSSIYAPNSEQMNKMGIQDSNSPFDLLEKNFNTFLGNLPRDRSQNDLFYFRSLDKEFTKSGNL